MHLDLFIHCAHFRSLAVSLAVGYIQGFKLKPISRDPRKRDVAQSVISP
jgi:hypothetical protein